MINQDHLLHHLNNLHGEHPNEVLQIRYKLYCLNKEYELALRMAVQLGSGERLFKCLDTYKIELNLKEFLPLMLKVDLSKTV
jgi:hypothetical protein